MIYSLDNTNLLDWFIDQKEPVGIIHQANCFHTMGGGIARQIAFRFPEAYEADKRDSSYGDNSKLGSFTHAEAKYHPNHFIFNLYSQFTFGMGRQTLYDPMVDGLERIRIHAITMGLTQLGVPFNMGCTLGGGNWKIVRAIIDSIFLQDSEISLVICQYEPKS